MNHPLASFPITSTNNIDEAESILSHELSDLHINKALDRQLFHLEMNGVHLNQTLLGYNHFNTETLIDPGEVQDAVILIIGTGTPAVFYIDGETVLCDNQGVILTPSKRVTIYRPADSGIVTGIHYNLYYAFLFSR